MCGSRVYQVTFLNVLDNVIVANPSAFLVRLIGTLVKLKTPKMCLWGSQVVWKVEKVCLSQTKMPYTVDKCMTFSRPKYNESYLRTLKHVNWALAKQ